MRAHTQVVGTARRWVAAAVAAALVVTMGTVAVLVAPAASAAVGSLTLAAADATVLAGDHADVLVDSDAPATLTNTATVASASQDVAPDGAGTASARADVRAVPLAVTGAETAALALLAALLLAGGTGAVLTARGARPGRRRG